MFGAKIKIMWEELLVDPGIQYKIYNFQLIIKSIDLYILSKRWTWTFETYVGKTTQVIWIKIFT